jgi:DNA-binding NarL/FixJ family response regulator
VIHVVIVDDHDLVRRALTDVLDGYHDITVAGTAASVDRRRPLRTARRRG